MTDANVTWHDPYDDPPEMLEPVLLLLSNMRDSIICQGSRITSIHAAYHGRYCTVLNVPAGYFVLAWTEMPQNLPTPEWNTKIIDFVRWPKFHKYKFPPISPYPEGATTCIKCQQPAVVEMDGVNTCISCGFNPQGSTDNESQATD